MIQLYPDLWQSASEHPLAEFPEAISNAYLLILEQGGNVLIYSTGREAIGPGSDSDDLDHIQKMGGIDRQYLGHFHEVSPSVARIKQDFGARLCCHFLEEEAVRKSAGVAVDLTFQQREKHPGGLEVIPTPGHTPGSACYLYKSPHGKTYLFTGDTLFFDNGVLEDGYIAGESNHADLKESIEQLRALEPDVVISAAAIGGSTLKEVSTTEWRSAIDEALRSLSKSPHRRAS